MIRAIAMSIIAFCFVTQAPAQIIFQDDMSTGANWFTVGTSDTLATFGYDYLADAIPEAPNSSGGAARTGLKMEANLSSAAVNEIAAIPTGVNLTGRYRIQVDLWGNYEFGGVSTTEFLGGFAGHDGVTPGRNGAGFLYTTDGGSSRDYRLYKNTGVQFIESGQYSDPYGELPPDVPPDPYGNNGDNAFLSAAYPGLDVGFALDPIDGQGPFQVGIQDDGDGGFQWMTMEIIVDPNGIGAGINTNVLGTAEVRLTSAASGTTVWMGTIDNTNGGATVNMTGAPALVYADLFTSVADTPLFQFGIFDNVLIEQLSSGVVDGDFDGNGLYQCNDVDQLVVAIVDVLNGGMPDLNFDMTGDGNVDNADLDDWRADAGAGADAPALTASGNPIQLGDATLDGVVDGLDFIEWNANKFTSIAEWCAGDFNADGIVDGLDFIQWNDNKFTSADHQVAVPEPTGFLLLLVSLPLVLRRRS
jgi:hypothetical protein